MLPSKTPQSAAKQRQQSWRLTGSDQDLCLVGISLDCPDPAVPAAFYDELLDGELVWSKPASAGVKVAGARSGPRRSGTTASAAGRLYVDRREPLSGETMDRCRTLLLSLSTATSIASI